MSKRVLIICCVGLLLGVTTFSCLPITTTIHAEIPLMDKRELVDASDVVLYGNVTKALPSKWTNPDGEKGDNVINTISTDVTIDIKKVYLGQPYDKKSVKVRVNYGEVGNERVVADAEPQFNIGEDVILFLRKPYPPVEDTTEEYYRPIGLEQGKFSLKSESKSDKVYENGTGRGTFTFSTIEKEIKNIIKDLEKNPLKKQTREEVEKINNESLGEN